MHLVYNKLHTNALKIYCPEEESYHDVLPVDDIDFDRGELFIFYEVVMLICLGK